MNEKKSFILYHDLQKQFSLLSMEDRGALITAIFEYAVQGQVFVDLSPMLRIAFSFIQDTLDRDRAVYEERCERNRKNGKKGGRPRADGAKPYTNEAVEAISKTEGLSEHPKKADNDIDNEIDNGIDFDNDIDIDAGIEKDCGAVPKEVFQTPWFSEPVAPLSPFSEPTAPPSPLSEQERRELKDGGVPMDYVEPRLSRARNFAERHGRSVSAVLTEWWKKDRTHQRDRPFSKAERDEAALEKSYDVDDFFHAAVERSYALLDG